MQKRKRFRVRLALSVLLALFLSVLAGQVTQAQPNGHHVTVNGVSLYYEIYGHGTPLVVLYGGPGLDHAYLLPQMLKLANHYELVFYDQRGSGQSTGAVDSVSMTVSNFVVDLEGLRRALHLDKMNLLGHSWGGLLAMEYAVRYPQRVTKIILASSVGATSKWEIPFAQNREARRTPQDSAALVKIMGSEGFAKRAPPVMQQFVKLFFRSYFHNQSLADSLSLTFTPETAQNVLPILALMSKQIASYDLRPQLRKLSCPVLILHGDDDPIPLKYAEETRACIPGSRLVVLKNCGHFSYIEAPDQFFAECEEFLESSR